jgi:hypothetical protein
MNLCIYPETLVFQGNWSTVEERKFRWLTPSPIEDGGQLESGRELGTLILPVSRLQFNPEGQPDRCVYVP